MPSTTMKDQPVIPVISPGKRVWSIPHVQSTILQYLPMKDIVTLLRVSEAHFQGAVGLVYQEIVYDKYLQAYRKWHNKSRARSYRQAVQVIKVGWDPYRKLHTRRETYFTAFPNAIKVNFQDQYNGPDSLWLGPIDSLSRDPNARPATYWWKTVLDLRSSNLSHQTCLQLRERWKHQYLVNCSFRTEIFSLTTKSTQDPIIQALNAALARYSLLDYIFEGFSCCYNRPKERFIASLAALKSRSLIQPRDLKFWSLNSGELAQVGLLGSSVETLRLGRDGTYPTDSTTSIKNFMSEFRPEHYPVLKHLTLELLGNQIGPSVLVPTVNYPRDQVRWALPRTGLKSLQISIDYPDSYVYSLDQLEEEKDTIRDLARHIFPLVDPYDPPTRSFSFRMYRTIPLWLMTLKTVLEGEMNSLIEKALTQGCLAGDTGDMS